MSDDLVPMDADADAEGGPDIEPSAVQPAVDAAMSLARAGHLFTYGWLHDMLGVGAKPEATVDFEPWNTRRAALIGLWWRMLNDQSGIYVKLRKGRGYEVIPNDRRAAVVGTMARRQLRAKVRDVSGILMNVPGDMTPREKQACMDELTHLGRVSLAVDYGRPKPPKPGQRRITTAR